MILSFCNSEERSVSDFRYSIDSEGDVFSVLIFQEKSNYEVFDSVELVAFFVLYFT